MHLILVQENPLKQKAQTRVPEAQIRVPEAQTRAGAARR